MNTIKSLSFVKVDPDTGLPNMWTPPRYQSWADGTAVGRRCADELIEFMSDTGNYPLLRSVINAMPCEPAGAVETGFFNRLAECAASSTRRPMRSVRRATVHPAS